MQKPSALGNKRGKQNKQEQHRKTHRCRRGASTVSVGQTKHSALECFAAASWTTVVVGHFMQLHVTWPRRPHPKHGVRGAACCARSGSGRAERGPGRTRCCKSVWKPQGTAIPTTRTPPGQRARAHAREPGACRRGGELAEAGSGTGTSVGLASAGGSAGVSLFHMRTCAPRPLPDDLLRVAGACWLRAGVRILVLRSYLAVALARCVPRFILGDYVRGPRSGQVHT